MNQRSKNIALFFSNVFFAFCIYICFCIYNLFLPICNWHRLLHDHDRHRLGHRPHPLRKLQLQVESHTKIAIQLARPGVPRHIGEGVAVTLPHDLHRAKPPFWLEHCCQLLLPVRAVNAGKLQWEHANFMLEIFQKQQWLVRSPSWPISSEVEVRWKTEEEKR